MAEKLPFRVVGDTLTPANQWALDKLKDRKYSKHDLVFVTITKPRNPKFNSLVHAGFAAMLADNLDDFSGLSPHEVLKRIQLEAGIGCEEIAIDLNGQVCLYRIPNSLSFESMDEEQFKEVFKRLCQYIADRYWPGLTPEEIEAMSKEMEGVK